MLCVDVMERVTQQDTKDIHVRGMNRKAIVYHAETHRCRNVPIIVSIKARRYCEL